MIRQKRALPFNKLREKISIRLIKKAFKFREKDPKWFALLLNTALRIGTPQIRQIHYSHFSSPNTLKFDSKLGMNAEIDNLRGLISLKFAFPDKLIRTCKERGLEIKIVPSGIAKRAVRHEQTHRRDLVRFGPGPISLHTMWAKMRTAKNLINGELSAFAQELREWRVCSKNPNKLFLSIAKSYPDIFFTLPLEKQEKLKSHFNNQIEAVNKMIAGKKKKNEIRGYLLGTFWNR